METMVNGLGRQILSDRTMKTFLSEKISQLWVLNRGDPNFCTHSMPLQVNKQNHYEKEPARRDIRKKKKDKTFLKSNEPPELLNKQ